MVLAPVISEVRNQGLSGPLIKVLRKAFFFTGRCHYLKYFMSRYLRRFLSISACMLAMLLFNHLNISFYVIAGKDIRF